MDPSKNSDNELRQQLISELKQKCNLVEDVIEQLAASRKHTEGNATKIKAQILSDVTKALNILRRKEIQLLRQVDVLEAHHLNILQVRYAELHQLLGNLRHTLYCAERQQDIPASCINVNDMDLVQAVCKQKFVAEPFAYRASVGELNVAIQNLAVVTTNLLAYQTDGDLLSKCLPSKFEDYEDGDHQLLHKTLEEIRGESQVGRKVESLIPKLSENKEDWLRERMMPALVECCKYPFCLPEHFISKDSSYWLRNESCMSEIPNMASYWKGRRVEEWLRKLNTKESCGSPGSLCCLASCGHPSKSIGSIVLISAPETEASSECSLNGKGSRSFPVTGALNETWCVMDSYPLDENGAMKKSQAVECCSLQKCMADAIPVDIENLDSILCAGLGRSHVDDIDNWLVSSRCAKAQDRSCVTSSLGIGGICRANELCTSFSECVSKPECTQRAVEAKLKQLNISGEMDKNNQFLYPYQQFANEKQWLQMSFGDVSQELCKKWLRNDSGLETENMDIMDDSVEADAGVVPEMMNSTSSWCKPTQDGARKSQVEAVCPTDVHVWLNLSTVQHTRATNHENCIRDDFKMYFQPDDLHAWLVTCDA